MFYFFSYQERKAASIVPYFDVEQIRAVQQPRGAGYHSCHQQQRGGIQLQVGKCVKKDVL